MDFKGKLAENNFSLVCSILCVYNNKFHLFCPVEYLT